MMNTKRYTVPALTSLMCLRTYRKKLNKRIAVVERDLYIRLIIYHERNLKKHFKSSTINN